MTVTPRAERFGAASWNANLRNPSNGLPLRADSEHSLTDGERRYPVIDAIPYLRPGREALAAAALAALDAGARQTALALLLADRDDWAPPAPPLAALTALATGDGLTFRSALDALALGPTAAYLTHRWSDPTFVAGLGLLAAHGPAPGARTFEIACGTGPYLRELARYGASAAGGDVVFAKLWLARRFVAPTARLICFDAAAAWPFADGAFDFVHCHDAFYFLPGKAFVAHEMRRVAGPRGTLAISHAHNAAVDNFSAGDPLHVEAYAALFPGARLYDDRELGDAVAAARAPRAAPADELASAAAVAFVVDPAHASCPAPALALPPDGARLARNPLYAAGADGRCRIRWPSERYEREYAHLATYALQTDAPERAIMNASEPLRTWARTRELVDLPARW